MVQKRVPLAKKPTAKSAAKTPAAKKRPAAKSTKEPAKKQAGGLNAETLTLRLDALLHTMRCISQHEDELCSLLHDARRTGRINAPLRRELQAILDELPAEEYTADLLAVRDITGVV